MAECETTSAVYSYEEAKNRITKIMQRYVAAPSQEERVPVIKNATKIWNVFITLGPLFWVGAFVIFAYCSFRYDNNNILFAIFAALSLLLIFVFFAIFDCEKEKIEKIILKFVDKNYCNKYGEYGFVDYRETALREIDSVISNTDIILVELKNSSCINIQIEITKDNIVYCNIFYYEGIENGSPKYRKESICFCNVL